MRPSTRVVLRQLIEAPEPLILPYGACALHAVMAERFGLKAIALSGAWATTYLLGRPDVGLISLTEMANLVRYMVMASDLPIVARQLREVFPARRVKRSAYSSGATAVGLAIAASEQAPTVTERFSRTFGVFRELDHGRDVGFDAILTRDTPLNPDGGEWTRRYRPAHNIGHFRFAECDRIEGGEPRGELTPFAEILFPFDPSLREGDLDGVAIQRAVGMPLVEERYQVDEAGIVSVCITDLESGWSREQRL